MSIDTLRVLAIGNSFSCDALSYLDGLLHLCGVKNVVVGNLYLGSCSLERHRENAESDAPVYSYFKSSPTLHVMRLKKNKCRFSEAVRDESWDVVTLQQSSAFLGFPESYEPHLTVLLKLLGKQCTNPLVRFAWHMTWAFENGCRHKVFERYSRSSEKMYAGAVECLCQCVLPHTEISFVIPCGTAIQNARTGSLSASLSRDGRHLSLRTGRYVCSLLWAKVLVGYDFSNIDLFGLLPSEMTAAYEAVENAYNEPLSVTPGNKTDKVKRYDKLTGLRDSVKAVIERHRRLKR